MTERSARQWKFKQYDSDDAGQKVGWTTVIPNPDSDYDAFHVVGAYATVGQDGGSVSVIEGLEDGERLWHDHLVRGLSRACSYAILIIPGEDTRIRNTDTVRFDQEKAQPLAGHSFHHDFDIDDNTVVWGKGDDELTANLRQSLEQHGLEDEYARIYLTINGSVGQRMASPDFSTSAKDIASNQIYDPSMSETAKDERARFVAYAGVLGERAKDSQAVLEYAHLRTLASEQFVTARESARAAFMKGEELRKTMIAPTVAYTPEGFRRNWPYMDAAESIARVSYGPELDSLQMGNFGKVTFELEREVKELRERQKFALRGAQALFALTVAGRHQ